jgi:hypothetical protein
MEELKGLRERLLKEAYELCYDKTPFPEGMICRDENGEQIFGSSVFNEEVFDDVKESSIYHIVQAYDGEIGFRNWERNFLTHMKYGYISEEEYKFITGEEVGTIPCYDCGVECEDEKIITIERLGRGVCLECIKKGYAEGK